MLPIGWDPEYLIALWGDGVKRWSPNGRLKAAQRSPNGRPMAYSLFEHVFIIPVLLSIPVDGKSRCEDSATRSMDDHLRMTDWRKGIILEDHPVCECAQTEYRLEELDYISRG